MAVPTKYVYPIPDNMSFSDAAAVAINFVVAHILLFDLAAIRPGKSLLLHSAGGGVVSFYFSFLINYYHEGFFTVDQRLDRKSQVNLYIVNQS